MVKIYLFLLVFFANGLSYSQTDSTETDSTNYFTDPIIVTDTKKEGKLSNTTLPVTVINSREIFNQSAVKLSDILSEQIGLFIMQDHGSGVQMQGLDPNYVLILIDGEPVTGRQAGAIDLSRFSAGNVKQIEIVKGPSSSLYGSDALAGVINIITKDAEKKFNAMLNAKYGTYNFLDLNTSLEYKKNKLGLYVYADRTSSSGYDLTPDSESKTSPEYYTYTATPKLSYELSKRSKLTFEGRFYSEVVKNVYMITSPGASYKINDKARVNDWSTGLKLNQLIGTKFDLSASTYVTGYFNNDKNTYDSDGSIYSDITFEQLFSKGEVLFRSYALKKNTQSLGAGIIRETVIADYIKDGRRSANIGYAFLQNEWNPLSSLCLVAGARYDVHTDYDSRLSPKVSALYKPFKWLSIRASAGSGYKAPNFQQLYLDWNNPIAGYSVYGVANFKEAFRKLVETGQIAEILIDPSLVVSIKPEISNAYNAGLELNPLSWANAKINFFRNDLENLIDVIQVAKKTNGQSVFSYFNLNRVYTQGFEAELNIRFLDHFGFSSGYQYLQAYDKESLEKIRRGEILKIGSTGILRPVQEIEYGGLFGRSKHSGVFKLSYLNEKLGIESSLRCIVRSKYGYADFNSNGILDNANEYIPGYALWNVAFTKMIGQYLSVQVGSENLLDRSDNSRLPELPGRTFFAGINLKY